MNNDKIVIKGAKENNLKNIDLEIPRNKLVIMTGLSGSGKTSLAFDTIYAEGQRRYVESLSAYARQFLGGIEKPNVEFIEGLSPAISIDQKTTSHNPRSTVGTITEIYDYLRLLYARVGTPMCPEHHVEITAQTISSMVNKIMEQEDEKKLIILAPMITAKKGTHQDVLAKLLKDGYLRAIIDGEMVLLENEIKLAKNKKHTIEVVVDRIVKRENINSRLYDSLEIALNLADGLCKVLVDQEELLFSSRYACRYCGFSIPNLEPRLFSFNAPIGACDECKGLGVTQETDVDYLMPDKNLSINQGGIIYYKNIVQTNNIEWQNFNNLCQYYQIDLDKPLKDFTDEEQEIILYGSKEPIEHVIYSNSGNVYHKNSYLEGVKTLLERRYAETTSQGAKEWYRSFMSFSTCSKCHGQRLNQQALSVYIQDKNIIEFTEMSIDDALIWLDQLTFDSTKAKIAELVLKEIHNRLSFLKNVGLEYLSLNRLAGSLSGGEAQRIRLATQIGAKLQGVLYVLDEPSIGLHQKDNRKLIETLKEMRDLGNSVLVVEHDEETMMESDYLIDIGPGAGIHGGEVVACGTPEEVMNNEKSLTGLYLSHKLCIPVPEKRRTGNKKYLQIKKAQENNLKNISVKIPLNTLTMVCGVSGSGKSTLVNEIICKALIKHLRNGKVKPGKYQEIKGLEHLDKVINITQDPIGRTPRSNPVTYTKVFDDIRDLFALTTDAKMKGYTKSRFSFNVKGGRCEACGGDGVKKISMNFLPDVYVPCSECHGKRYNEETLAVKYRGKSIFDVLDMTVEEGVQFFSNIPKIQKKLQTLYDVGLDYIKLGQSSTTLSGGEAQRVKLASELQKTPTGKTIFILDEPTTGLHTHDVKKLLKVLQKIVDNGDTVLVIEHNLDMLKSADYLIDLGPDGGVNGGEVVACGTPEKVSKVAKSYTGQYLKKVL